MSSRRTSHAHRRSHANIEEVVSASASSSPTSSSARANRKLVVTNEKATAMERGHTLVAALTAGVSGESAAVVAARSALLASPTFVSLAQVAARTSQAAHDDPDATIPTVLVVEREELMAEGTPCHTLAELMDAHPMFETVVLCGFPSSAAEAVNFNAKALADDLGLQIGCALQLHAGATDAEAAAEAIALGGLPRELEEAAELLPDLVVLSAGVEMSARGSDHMNGGGDSGAEDGDEEANDAEHDGGVEEEKEEEERAGEGEAKEGSGEGGAEGEGGEGGDGASATAPKAAKGDMVRKDSAILAGEVLEVLRGFGELRKRYVDWKERLQVLSIDDGFVPSDRDTNGNILVEAGTMKTRDGRVVAAPTMTTLLEQYEMVSRSVPELAADASVVLQCVVDAVIGACAIDYGEGGEGEGAARTAGDSQGHAVPNWGDASALRVERADAASTAVPPRLLARKAVVELCLPTDVAQRGGGLRLPQWLPKSESVRGLAETAEAHFLHANADGAAEGGAGATELTRSPSRAATAAKKAAAKKAAAQTRAQHSSVTDSIDSDTVMRHKILREFGRIMVRQDPGASVLSTVSDMRDAAATGQAAWGLGERLWSEQIASSALPQVLLHALEASPDVLTRYLPDSDCVLVALHQKTPIGRVQRESWSPLTSNPLTNGLQPTFRKWWAVRKRGGLQSLPPAMYCPWKGGEAALAKLETTVTKVLPADQRVVRRIVDAGGTLFITFVCSRLFFCLLIFFCLLVYSFVASKSTRAPPRGVLREPWRGPARRAAERRGVEGSGGGAGGLQPQPRGEPRRGGRGARRARRGGGGCGARCRGRGARCGGSEERPRGGRGAGGGSEG